MLSSGLLERPLGASPLVYDWYTIKADVGALRIEAIEVEDLILDKIESRHGVRLEEVEQTCYGEDRHVRRSREGLYKLFGRSEAGRYLLVVLAEVGQGVWRLVTAREMNDGERRLYRRAIGA